MKTSCLSVCALLITVEVLAQPQSDDLSADAILAKTQGAYTALASVRIEGQITHPWANPEAAPTALRGTLAPLAFAMVMARPCLYRVEAQTGMEGAPGRVASWCDGKAHHRFYGRIAYRVDSADRDQAACMASEGNLAFVLFYEIEPNQLMTVRGWKRVADAEVNGEPCYVLEAGGGTPLTATKLLLRIARKDLLIRQIESRLTPLPITDERASFALRLAGQKVTPAAIAKAKQEMQSPAYAEPLARKSTLVVYSAVETNKTYAMSEFTYALPEGVQEHELPPRRRPVPGKPSAAPASKP